MRIAVNTRFLLPNRLEGFGWYTHEILRRMVLAHPEHQFLFLFDRPFNPDFVYGPNVETKVLFPPARHPILFYFWFEWAVPRALRQWKADIFFSPDSFLSLSTSVKTVLTVHDVIPLQMPQQVKWIHRIYYWLFLKRFIRRADKVITVSEYTKNSIVETTGIAPDKIAVIYNGCRDTFVPIGMEEKIRTRQHFSNGREFFFYTGAIHPRKNIPRLIRAFDAFKLRTGSNTKLLLGGRFAWKTGEVSTALSDSKYRSDIQILGYVSDADLPRLMGAALALVYPSLSEGFGLPLIEAMNCDVPVLCANTTALPEVAGDAAFYVDPENEESISEGLFQLWNDPELRFRFIEKGRLQREKFSWDTAAEMVEREIGFLNMQQ